jgi:hypothetical protein
MVETVVLYKVINLNNYTMNSPNASVEIATCRIQVNIGGVFLFGFDYDYNQKHHKIICESAILKY